MSQLPIATQWTLNAVAPYAKDAVQSVVVIFAQKTGQKGTGWLCSNQHIVTNEHVIRGCNASDIIVMFVDGTHIVPANIVLDATGDLAVLTLTAAAKFLPLKIDMSPLEIGTRVIAWGHPLGYNGPPPLLTVGYMAGLIAYPTANPTVTLKRLVINAALNPGNSGGPLAAWGENTVRGVVVSKHAPITDWLKSCMEALAKQQSGFVYTATDNNGNQKNLSEAQIVAELLQYFRSMTQVVIGEAISVEDLIAFLDTNKIPWSKFKSS